MFLFFLEKYFFIIYKVEQEEKTKFVLPKIDDNNLFLMDETSFYAADHRSYRIIVTLIDVQIIFSLWLVLSRWRRCLVLMYLELD